MVELASSIEVVEPEPPKAPSRSAAKPKLQKKTSKPMKIEPAFTEEEF
jgi:hypothetical protein